MMNNALSFVNSTLENQSPILFPASRANPENRVKSPPHCTAVV